MLCFPDARFAMHYSKQQLCTPALSSLRFTLPVRHVLRDNRRRFLGTVGPPNSLHKVSFWIYSATVRSADDKLKLPMQSPQKQTALKRTYPSNKNRYYDLPSSPYPA